MYMTTTVGRVTTVAVAVVLILAACGSGDGIEPTGDAHSQHGAGDHRPIEIGEDVVPPSISMEVIEDPLEGWNLAVTLSNFRLAPENVSGPHVDGEGHLHLYIDGRKVGRIYSPWHHISMLEAGEREIRVELSANDHSPLALDGDVIDAVATVVVEEAGSSAMGHGHMEERAAGEPFPSLSLRVVDDPAGGWNLHAAPNNFRLAPENASGPHVEGEGHMHLYINGHKVARLYGNWYQLPPLEAGTHEIRVDLQSNDHARLTAEGRVIDAVARLEVSREEATALAGEGGHSHDGTESHSMASGTGYAADVADADQTVAIEIVGGVPVDGFRRISVDLGSVLALAIKADIADEVHIHGYDILQPVAEGRQASFAFVAEIPGVFEVELERSGRLLLLLEVS